MSPNVSIETFFPYRLHQSLIPNVLPGKELELATPKLPFSGNRIVTSVCTNTKLSYAGVYYVATLFTRRLSVVVFIFYFSQSSPSGSLNIIIPSLSIFSHISVETKYHVHTYKLL